MAINSHTHPHHDQNWTNYAGPEQPGPQHPGEPSEQPNPHGSHQEHNWMMLLMCIPLVAIGIWLLATGAGAGALISGVICMAMMAVMHLGMGRSGHRH